MHVGFIPPEESRSLQDPKSRAVALEIAMSRRGRLMHL